jgi:hypothetical protein
MGLFDTAKAIEQPAKPKGKGKLEVQVKGIEQLAMVDALQKALDGIRAGIESEVKGVALTGFLKHVRENGTRPESIRGVEGGASASLEIRRKGSNIGLTEQQVALLRDHGLEPHKDTTVPALFALNPTYAEDAALLRKVEAALAGIVPPDFIVKQSERARFTVDEPLLERAVKLMREKQDVPVDVLTCLTVLACKPKLVTTNLHSILDFVRGLIGEPVFGEASNEARTVKLALVKAA